MLLAVDTSTPQIGLALYDGDQVLAESLWTSKARHTVELAPAVAEMFAHAGMKISQVKALGVAIGPGSFTSLRVGLSFVKGLAFALTVPVIGINTLDVVAASQPAGNLPLVCVLPAGRGRLAVCWFVARQGNFKGINKTLEHASETAWQTQGNSLIMSAAALSTAIIQDTIVCGDLNHEERQTLKHNAFAHLVSPANSVRRPAILAELGYTRWKSGFVDDISSLAPLYLHLADPIPEISPGAGPA